MCHSEESAGRRENLFYYFCAMKADRHIGIMGIVNLTDDSYFAQSRCSDTDAVLRRVGQMADEGADVIDFGAWSSRPGSVPSGPEEEWRRLAPALSAVREAFPDIRISVDTYWSSVVERTYDLIGDFLVNDISAGEDDPLMLPTVGRLGLEYVAMHKRGTSLTMQSLADYDDVVDEVIRYFEMFSAKAADAGIRRWMMDPGFGFAKTLEQNYALLPGLTSLRDASAAWPLQPSRLLVGVSRKSMIYKPLGISPEDSLAATQVVHLAALQNGADILRVHDPAEAFRTLSLYRLLG